MIIGKYYFFRDMGLAPREVDLIYVLHLDRPSHLRFHFEFYENVRG